jgi:hypothetical protein
MNVANYTYYIDATGSEMLRSFLQKNAKYRFVLILIVGIPANTLISNRALLKRLLAEVIMPTKCYRFVTITKFFVIFFFSVLFGP